MKRTFTLIEVMVAFVLLAIASSIVGVRMHKAIEKKKFYSEIERFKNRLFVSQRLALAMQSDWKGVLKKENDGWTFLVTCEESNVRQLKPLRMEKKQILFNGREVQELEFSFFSTGIVFPLGKLTIQKGSEFAEWELSKDAINYKI